LIKAGECPFDRGGKFLGIQTAVLIRVVRLDPFASRRPVRPYRSHLAGTSTSTVTRRTDIARRALGTRWTLCECESAKDQNYGKCEQLIRSHI
jgi:hypothetical protein